MTPTTGKRHAVREDSLTRLPALPPRAYLRKPWFREAVTPGVSCLLLAPRTPFDDKESSLPMLTLITAAAVAAITYLASCRVWPYARCRSCYGAGTGSGSNRRRWNHCRACRGSGKRLRLGARLLTRKNRTEGS